MLITETVRCSRILLKARWVFLGLLPELLVRDQSRCARGHLPGQGPKFWLLNGALITLLPKKDRDSYISPVSDGSRFGRLKDSTIGPARLTDFFFFPLFLLLFSSMFSVFFFIFYFSVVFRFFFVSFFLKKVFRFSILFKFIICLYSKNVQI